MHTVTLGSTGITVNKNAFGALPIQRVPDDYAVRLLQKAYDGGIRFFDTARMYTDSEHKLNLAFSHMREKVFISTKTQATTVEQFWSDLEISLSCLGYIDIYQFHNPAFCPKPGDGTGLYEAMLEAKAQGKIRHIGITNHRLSVAKEAIESGLYETLQFPFCYLSTEADMELVKMCAEKNMGFIAMKALSGGLITNSAAAYAYLAQFDNVLPIWGVADVLVKLQRLILGQNAHCIDAGVDTVREGEVDNAVFSAKGDCRLGGLFRQDLQAAALTTGQQHGNCALFLKEHRYTPS